MNERIKELANQAGRKECALGYGMPEYVDWLGAHNLKGVWINKSFYTTPEAASLLALKWCGR